VQAEGCGREGDTQKVYCSWSCSSSKPPSGLARFKMFLIDTGSLFPQKATTAPTRQHDKQVPQPLLRFCFWLPRFGDIHSPHASARLLGATVTLRPCAATAMQGSRTAQQVAGACG
jgi:hypothetical protein